MRVFIPVRNYCYSNCENAFPYSKKLYSVSFYISKTLSNQIQTIRYHCSVFELSAAITVYAPDLSHTAVVSWDAVNVTDNSGETITPQQALGPEKGASVGVGVHYIQYTASDSAGNNETCTFSITVEGKHN